jgi:hypothetical protein
VLLFATQKKEREREIKMNITLNLQVTSYGSETWFHTLKVEHRLRAFKNRMMQKRSRPVKRWG